MNISKSPCIGCKNQDKSKEKCIAKCKSIKQYQKTISKSISVEGVTVKYLQKLMKEEKEYTNE